jgi:hypothetical protein
MTQMNAGQKRNQKKAKNHDFINYIEKLENSAK